MAKRANGVRDTVTRVRIAHRKPQINARITKETARGLVMIAARIDRNFGEILK